MINVGINGFGRIGRAIYRINLKQNIFKVVVMNDINPSVDNIAYLLKYDSTYGVLDVDVNNSNGSLQINKSEPIEIFHSIRLYTLTEIGNMLKKSGFKIASVYGSYDGNKYVVDSPRMIVVAIKDS